MDPTLSVSKGIFVFKNGATRSKIKGKRKKSVNSSQTEYVSLLGDDITEQPYYRTYKKTWQSIRSDIYRIHEDNSTKTMKDLVEFIRNSYENNLDNILPTAVLLTGINQPDHSEQFGSLSHYVRNNCQSLTVILEARDCTNLRSTVQTMVSGFIDGCNSDDEDDHDVKSLRRGQYTMTVLEAWYKSEVSDDNNKRNLVVILPGFEGFSVQVLQDFVLILKSYCQRIPIVLVLGVATAISTLHSSLPYHVTSKMHLKVFHLQSAIAGLNKIIEELILAPYYNFFLSGKVFTFLTDTFLFYDFSINGFVQGLKYCIMEHFHQGNAFALCDNYTNSLRKITSLKHDDLETIRQLPSFRPYIEQLKDEPKKIIGLLTDDDYLKKKLPKLLKDCHIFLKLFRCFLEFFTIIVEDLPKSPLGRLRREVYSRCVSSPIIDLAEFKECWQVLGFLSKNDFIRKFQEAADKTRKFTWENFGDDTIDSECKKMVDAKLTVVEELLKKISAAGLEVPTGKEVQQKSSTDLTKLNRHELREKLLEMSKSEKPISEFLRSVHQTLDYIKSEIIERHLRAFTKAGNCPPLYELFVFSDLWSVRQHIVGSPRAALHTALNDPHHYLQCDCCELNRENSDGILCNMPDLSIAYKLHLESGRLINLYDWMQAFRYVVDSNSDESEEVDPQIQARFTRAVAELQFLGFIKSSKRKTDHVTRLTW